MSEQINIEVESQPVPIVQIKVDEDSSQNAEAAAERAEAAAERAEDAVDDIDGKIAGKLDKGAYPGTAMDLLGLIETKADLVNGLVPASQLPSFVDDILEGYLSGNVFYKEVGHTNIIPPESGKIYVDITTGQKNRQYRYSGSLYIQITNGLIATTDDVPEGANNKYSTLALVMSYVLTGISFVTSTPITAADTIVSAFGKMQKQISDLVALLSGKQAVDNQLEISANSNVSNAWHGQTILFTVNCTITVPSALNNSLMFAFRTMSGVTVTWAITSPFVWEITPASTLERTTGHFMRRGTTNTIILDS